VMTGNTGADSSWTVMLPPVNAFDWTVEPDFKLVMTVVVGVDFLLVVWAINNGAVEKRTRLSRVSTTAA
jgi:hypothetical protein